MSDDDEDLPLIEYLNLDTRTALVDNHPTPVANMFDCDGEETDDPDRAIAVVLGPLADGKWCVAELNDPPAGQKRNRTPPVS